MISKKVHEDAVKLLTFNDRIFFTVDEDYVNRIIDKGFKYSILEGVKVYHAAGEFHNMEYKKVFENKYSDYKKGYPTKYRLVNRVKRRVSYGRFLSRIDELSKCQLEW